MTGSSRQLLEQQVQPLVEQFLARRGLELSATKTQIVHIEDGFDSLYKFYYFGFNVRATDLQAFIGLRQLQKLDSVVKKRNDNYNYYNELLMNDDEMKYKTNE